VIGCQLRAADQLKGEVEDEISDPMALIRELSFWAELRETLTVEVAAGAAEGSPARAC
jgi:hypothetical protein